MFEKLHTKNLENVVIAGMITPAGIPALFQADMHEMELLCKTAGARIMAVIVQKRNKPDAGVFFGRGKLTEIRSTMKETGSRTLVVDAELSPGQIRSIEKIIQGKLIDRSQLILDIFAMHAHTVEARVQVELAQMRTLYPRLTGAWSHFSQQVGGIGTRGPGEKQLEVDRRLVQKKIADLKRRLARMEKARHVQRSQRTSLFTLALVGYTNVGKSSLLNALCRSRVGVEDKLFATLDTATRRMYCPGAGPLIISDSVGFLRKLPHHLVASFHSTLEVINQADLLIHVMDASCEWVEQQNITVHNVLENLGAGRIPRLSIYNKSDCIDDPFHRKKLEIAHPDALFVSAFSAQDMLKLKHRIAEVVRRIERERTEALRKKEQEKRRRIRERHSRLQRTG